MNNLLLIIGSISYLHALINLLEKRIIQEFIGIYKRPLFMCQSNDKINFTSLGMPSGHSETFFISGLLLLYHNYINLYIFIISIIIISLQRILYEYHTFNQVISGLCLGGLYSCLYIKINNWSSTILFIPINLIVIYSLILFVKEIYNKHNNQSQYLLF